MQQAIRKSHARGVRERWNACRKNLDIFGVLAGELFALASLGVSLAAGLFVLTTLLAGI